MVADLQNRPVAFRVKDFADGWIIFQDEKAAYDEAEKTGAVMQGLYVRDGSSAPIPQEVAHLISELRDANRPLDIPPGGTKVIISGSTSIFERAASALSSKAEEVDAIRAKMQAMSMGYGKHFDIVADANFVLWQALQRISEEEDIVNYGHTLAPLASSALDKARSILGELQSNQSEPEAAPETELGGWRPIASAWKNPKVTGNQETLFIARFGLEEFPSYNTAYYGPLAGGGSTHPWVFVDGGGAYSENWPTHWMFADEAAAPPLTPADRAGDAS